jgi:hypothetical protein
MLRTLMGKADSMQEDIGYGGNEIEIPRKNQMQILEIKTNRQKKKKKQKTKTKDNKKKLTPTPAGVAARIGENPRVLQKPP